jgi:ADP-heptose:LPS heptosyltransferase
MKFWFKKGAWVSRAARAKVAALVPASIRSIAVIRHAALGDMVLTRPFLLELRRHFPQAAITLSLVSNYERGAPRDLVDRVHTMYGSDRKDVSLREQIRRGRQLGAPTLLFYLAATPRSLWLCALNRAQLKIGFPFQPYRRKLFYDAAVLRSDFKFEAETLLDMLHLLGLRTEYPLRFDMPGIADKRERPYLVYFAGASTPDKCWPGDRFSALIGTLALRYPQYDHLVLEGRAPWESTTALLAPLTALNNVRAINGAGLEQTIGLLKGAQLLVCNDTGIRNLAIATGTPTVGIFFATPVFLYWPRLPQHDVVFDPAGGVPSLAAALTAVEGILATPSPAEARQAHSG